MMALAAASEPTDEPRVIARKYRLETLLCEGGMGSVWRAFNLQLEVPVAIKLLRAGLNRDELGERLRVEARAAAKLVHPNIVRVFDIGESETGEPFIVMELLNGTSLAERLEHGPLPAICAVQLLLPIAEALSLAHSRGVIHRDLKPENIFLAREGEILEPKLLDFGIAKVTGGATAARASLTQTGLILGSPNYMSPEQAYGCTDIDHRSDIWSYCVVLHEAMTGRQLFQGSSVQATLRSVVQDEPAPLADLAGVDDRLSDIVKQGLAKDREQRPASIFALGRALAAWLFEQGVHEDATGASLEAKWLGRGAASVPASPTHTSSAPQAQHDYATLVSVVHPRPRIGSDPPALSTRAARARRWPALALAATAALSSWAGWAGLRELRAPNSEQPIVERAAPASREQTPAAALIAAAPARPIDSLPVEHPAEPTSVRAPPPLQLEARSTTARAARSTASRGATKSAPFDPATELMDPY